jgi:hypothetical protein
VTSRLCPEQGQKAIVLHVCITEVRESYFLVYSWLTNTTELQRRSVFFPAAKNASVFAEEWWQFLLQSAIFAAIFCRFVCRRLLTHAHSLWRLLCTGGGWKITEFYRSPVNMIIFDNIQYTFECIGRYLFDLRRFALYSDYIIVNNINGEYRHL